MSTIDFPFGLKTRIEELLGIIIERQKLRLEMDRIMLEGFQVMSDVSQNDTDLPDALDFDREQ